MESRVLAALSRKGADVEKIAARAIRDPESIADLFQGLGRQEASVKYGSEKVLRRISELKPELVYPHFEAFVKLLESKNSFLKWGAIMTLANLAAVDGEGRLEKIFDRYFAPVTGPEMVTAANIVGSAVKIVRAKPELTGRIVQQILRVENARFERRGAPSPECRNVVCGQAIAAFDEIFDRIEDQEPVLEFVRRQLVNTRPAVRKSAEKFLKRHG